MKRFMVTLLAVVSTLSLVSAHADEKQPAPPKCEMGNCLDPLFTVQFPHTGSAVTHDGWRIPLPIHYYDASLFFAIGTADLAAARAATAGTAYEPVATEDGHAVGVFGIANYADSDIESYHEALTAFIVHTGPETIPNDEGALVAALLDPSNEAWGTRLLLDHQMPIDAGREYLGTPKVPTPRVMDMDIQPGHVSFNFTEVGGTPVASGDVTLDSSTAPAVTASLVQHQPTAARAVDLASRGYLRLRCVYPDVRAPNVVAHAFVAAAPGPMATAGLSEYTAGSHITANPDVPFGADLAALSLTPKVTLAATDLHMVLDATL